MSLFELLEKIVGTEGDEVGITLPEGEINRLGLKILQQEAKRRGKTLKFTAGGPRTSRMLDQPEDNFPPDKGKFGSSRLRLGVAFRRRFAPIFLLMFATILLLGGGGYWVLNLLPRAQVTLTLRPLPMVKEIGVFADTEATELNAEASTLPGREIVVEVSGQKSIPATGAATVGEKAKISIKVKNCGSESLVHLSPGDKLAAVSDPTLIFLLDSVVDIAGHSPPNPCPEASGSATAEKIGNSYNAPTVFSILGFGYPAFYAERTNLTRRGESREVTVVSSADQAKVLEELRADLRKEGKEELNTQANSDWVIVQEALKEEVVEQKFLQRVGEQAETASLTLKLKFTAIAYRREDLGELISQVFGKIVPEGYELYPGETKIDTLSATLGDKTLNLSIKATGRVIPKLDLTGIKTALAGRKPKVAQEYLASLANITGYKLQLWPNLPERLRRVPKNTNRIGIELKMEDQI